MVVSLLGLVVGLVGLFWGGEWLVTGAARLARSLGIPALIVGLTVVSIGTSMPELLVSLSAAFAGSSDIAIGNVVGSNIANIGLILGVSGLIFPISVHVTLLRREIPILVAITALAYVLLADGLISRSDGGVLLATMVAFIGFMVVASIREQDDIPDDTNQDTDDASASHRLRDGLRLIAGIAILMIGAQLTVDNATTIARAIGISELVIGVTLVAVGTSLPELVTSTMAALRRESDIAIGNVVGSNIFNLVGILGATAFVQPINVPSQVVAFDALVMIAFTLLVIPFALNRQLGRTEAAIFLTAYVAYVGYTVFA